VDPAILYISPPVASIAEFGASRDYRLLPLNDAARNAVIKQYPYYQPIDIPAGVYSKVTYDTPVVGTANGVMVNANIPEELAYQIVKATFDNIERVRASYPTLANFSLEKAAQGGLIPFHDGAIRFYRERQVWKDPA
jgi:TRAP transporter TAXI family solute receptor